MNPNKIFYTGNLQIDLLNNCLTFFNDNTILQNNNLEENNYILLTVHRHYNTNQLALKELFDQLAIINEIIFFPCHPRTKKIILDNKINIPSNIIIHDPVNYLEMQILERYCKLVITDSGGVQVESAFLSKKCLILRSETEWVEILHPEFCELCEINNLSKNLFRLLKSSIQIPKPLIPNCGEEIVKIIYDKI